MADTNVASYGGAAAAAARTAATPFTAATAGHCPSKLVGCPQERPTSRSAASEVHCLPYSDAYRCATSRRRCLQWTCSKVVPRWGRSYGVATGGGSGNGFSKISPEPFGAASAGFDGPPILRLREALQRKLAAASPNSTGADQARAAPRHPRGCLFIIFHSIQTMIESHIEHGTTQASVITVRRDPVLRLILAETMAALGCPTDVSTVSRWKQPLRVLFVHGSAAPGTHTVESPARASSGKGENSSRLVRVCLPCTQREQSSALHRRRTSMRISPSIEPQEMTMPAPSSGSHSLLPPLLRSRSWHKPPPPSRLAGSIT